MINEGIANRLYNWKFTSALRSLDDTVSEEEREILEALSETFGNVGWFDGHMSVIVAAALKLIAREQDEDSNE